MRRSEGTRRLVAVLEAWDGDASIEGGAAGADGAERPRERPNKPLRFGSASALAPHLMSRLTRLAADRTRLMQSHGRARLATQTSAAVVRHGA